LLAFKVASNLLVKRIYNLVSNNETNKKLKKAKTKEQIIELFLNNQQIN
jgi:mannitol/fructose-specific phosphotransferase system IIA component (Ntr-type)